ncbi:hypothetical protein ACFP4H_11860 [Pseudophaeobacter arcticus]|uniref:hypothetical protein n=3 Tax=Pseudophaeobacter arcticus TaxID=385492 RepID=UPI00041D2E10|nr:hypothetical protein [Pseudophaeobacter arcticus]
MLGLGLGIGAGQALPLARYNIGGKAPAVVADYSAGVYGLDGRAVTFGGLFDFARLSAAWKLNALGHWVKALAGEPRRGHHIWQGGKLVPAGLAVCSEVRTNLLLNSDALSTQVVTVAAVEHVLSFTGTGTVTLSGAATDGPLIGAGTGEVNSVRLAFTPSGGSLTLTVSGDVQTAQLEAGPFATDYISTEAAQVSTAAESLQIAPVELARAVGVFGPELNPDPSFATVWNTADGGISAADGKLIFEDVAVNDRSFVVRSPATAGDTILLEVDVDDLTSGALRFAIGGANNYALAAGKYSFLIPATTAASTIGVYADTAPTNAVVSRFSARVVTMPEALTFMMTGTMTRAKEPESSSNAIPLQWESDADNFIDLCVSTAGAHTGKPSFRSKVGGVLTEVLGADDAMALGSEEAFALAFVLDATHIEGFYNGVSTGQTAHGGMAALLAAPMQLFPVGSATIKDLRLWPNALPSAAMVGATS